MISENHPGHFMIADGHMDFTFRRDSKDPRINSDLIFHDNELINIAKSASKNLNLNTCVGCYCWTLGPSYETPAKIQDMARLGGSAVGMSTVPEIISAAKSGIKSLTISCLTNYAAGISATPLTHEEVVSNANRFDSQLIISIFNANIFFIETGKCHFNSPIEVIKFFDIVWWEV